MSTISLLNTSSDLSGKTAVTAEGDRTITGLLTYSRSTSAPFAVNVGAAKVTNLDADKVDGLEGASFFQVTGGTLTGDLLFTDATYDIGKTGATRPRDGFFSRDVTVGRFGIFSDDLKLAALKKLYLDGGGDTYLTESAANTLDAYTNAVRALTIDSTQFIDSPTQPRCSAYNSATQSINDATGTALTFDSEDFDVGAMHSTVSNTSRVTIPAGADGLYLLIGQTTFAPNATGIRQMWFKKNGTTDIGGFQKSVSNIAGSATSLVTSQLAVLAAADYVELFATQNSGGALNVGDASRVDASALQAVKLW